jgi:hypothetical protein
MWALNISSLPGIKRISSSSGTVARGIVPSGASFRVLTVFGSPTFLLAYIQITEILNAILTVVKWF